MSSSRDRAYGQKVGDSGVRIDPPRQRVSKLEGVLIRWVAVAFVLALVAPAIIWIWRLALGLA